MRGKRPTVAEQIRLGAYFFTTGAIDLAIGQFTAATRRAPHSATAWMNLGAAYLEKKDLARAEESLQRALKLRPDFAAAYYHLAQLSEERGENDGAKQYYQRAADLAPHTDLGRHALELATGWRPHIYVAGEDKRNRVD
jgi:tetratricopeptide (TPR) repeat protein